MTTYTHKIYGTLIIMAASMAMTSCSSDDGDMPVTPPADSSMISFGINAEDFGSRALIAGTDNLTGNCKRTDKFDIPADNTERIGIIADLRYKNSANAELGTEDVRERRYLNHWLYNNGTSWDYYKEGTPPSAGTSQKKHWVRGTLMMCTAYYPAKFMKKIGHVTPETTNAEDFTLTYTAITNQEDLMLGYNIIDSDMRTDKDGNNISSNNQIPIVMEHALAALRFEFMSPDPDSNDKLTKVWLDDTGTDENPDFFAVAGTMTYKTVSTDADGNKVYSKQTTWERQRSGLYENYIWENSEGLPIEFNGDASQAKKAVPYTAGSNNSETNPGGDIYCNNGGYILIIPQKIPEDLYLCFTTAGGGPQKVIKKKLLQEGRLTHWEYNHRYTYTVKLSAAGVELDVDVQPWNEIQSNSSVEF